MIWRIELLGGIRATREGTTLSRFESSRAVALLARLALFPRRVHPRAELLELLWPEVDPDVARGRLRHTLLTLRRPLEAGLPAGSVLIADRQTIRLNPEAVQTDVAAFEAALARGDFAAARTLYAGELLPGLWDDWVVAERHRLEARAQNLEETPEEARLSPRESSARAHSIPPYLTAFFGRERERAELTELLSRHRLVTLTGLGGTGKTRLAAEMLKRRGADPAPAAFVSLAECVGASQIPRRICAVLGLPTADIDPIEQICLNLGETPALLALDNLEHLADSGGAEMVAALLARLPALACLVTSRRSLDLPGERLYPLEPLPDEESVALFLDRAQAVRPGFCRTEGNRADVEAVCRGLEGIPLALELAASRLRALSVAEMRQELQGRFDWLARTGLRGGKGDRHRSLAATMEWSWRLLSPSQQQFLAALSLFRGRWSARAAAAVTERSDARERLEALAADSLVASGDCGGETRFTMLETVREFVAPRLEDSPGARRRFRDYFLAHPSRDDNLVAAWEYALEDADAGPAYAFAARPYADWTARLGVERARSLLERTLALPADAPELWLRTTHLLAQCLLRTNDRQGAIARMDEAAAQLEGAPDELLAEALSLQAHIGLYDAPHEKTLALLERCRRLAGNPIVRAEALRIQGCLTCWTPAYESAQALFDEAEALYPPEDPGKRRLLLHRAHLERRRNNFDESLRLYRLCADKARRAEDGILLKTCQSNLADILTCQGRWDEAIETGLECLKIEEAFGDRHALLNLLWNLARPFLETGQPERATRLLGAAAALWEREVRPLTTDEIEERDGVRRDLARALGEAECGRLWSEGERLTLKQALALAQEKGRKRTLSGSGA